MSARQALAGCDDCGDVQPVRLARRARCGAAAVVAGSPGGAMFVHATHRGGVSPGEVVLTNKGATDFRFLQRFRGSGELHSLCMAHNRIHSMLGLDGHIQLKHLDLSHNTISRIEGLEGLGQLQTLRLRHNRLIAVEGFGRGLPHLRTLDLSNNDLRTFEVQAVGLVELDLSYNALSELADTRNLRRLESLNLRGNLIKQLDGAPQCLPPSMRTLDLSQNCIGAIAELQHLSGQHYLERLHLSENVFAATAQQCGFTYRPFVLALVPGVCGGELPLRSTVVSGSRLLTRFVRLLWRIHQACGSWTASWRTKWSSARRSSSSTALLGSRTDSSSSQARNWRCYAG
jgi:hypothetical protein